MGSCIVPEFNSNFGTNQLLNILFFVPYVTSFYPTALIQSPLTSYSWSCHWSFSTKWPKMIHCLPVLYYVKIYTSLTHFAMQLTLSKGLTIGGDPSFALVGEAGGVESLFDSSSFPGRDSFFASDPSLLLLVRLLRLRGSFLVDAFNASINISLSWRNDAVKEKMLWKHGSKANFDEILFLTHSKTRISSLGIKTAQGLHLTYEESGKLQSIIKMAFFFFYKSQDHFQNNEFY